MQTKTVMISREDPDRALLREAADIIRRGGLVAFPTETVYGLGGNALDPLASERIYAAKGRPSDNPLIVHIADMAELPPLVREIPEMARRLMDAYWPGPMTLIFPKADIVPDATTGGLDTVAVRMPSHPVAAALIRETGLPIAAPSANASGRPSPTKASHVAEDLSGRIDMILDGGEVDIGLESTVIDVTGEEPVILRPGYISLEAVRRAAGAGEDDPTILKKPEGDLRPKAPGMKYRHYAPRARIQIFAGAPGAVTEQILSLMRADLAEGRRVGVLCSEETAASYEGADVKILGSQGDEEAAAHNLFNALRECDEDGVDVIYAEAFEEGEIAEAVMNRMLKAAGYSLTRL